AADLYDDLTQGCAKPVRLETLVYAAAARVPGLAPSPEAMVAERARPLAEKRGHELAQGLLVEHFLALPRAGRHLVESMLRPKAEALELIDSFRETGTADLGQARV